MTARVTDPETSHQAAPQTGRFTDTHAAIYAIVDAHGPISDIEIKARLDRAGIPVSDSGARTRRAELVRDGFLRDSKMRGESLFGRAVILWEVNPK